MLNYAIVLSESFRKESMLVAKKSKNRAQM